MISYNKIIFARHKGYCTAAHLDAVRSLGPCAEHRRSFQPIKVIISSIICILIKVIRLYIAV